MNYVASTQLQSCADETEARPAEFHPRRGKGLTCWVVQPDQMALNALPLIAVHGLHRRASAQASLFGSLARRLGRPVIAPHFDDQSWPNFQQLVRRGRADLALLELLDDLRMIGLFATDQFDLFGYSGGAQFAHRFAMLYPHKVRSLSVAAAGWYTFPDDQEYPYGLAPSGRFGKWGAAMSSGLDAFLDLDIRVFVGSEDDAVDRHTRSSQSLDDQQGRTRLDRARNWVHALQNAPKANRRPNKTSLHILDGCGHSFEDCIRVGNLDHLVFAQPASNVS